jgi:hypothetical protein
MHGELGNKLVSLATASFIHYSRPNYYAESMVRLTNHTTPALA